MSADGRAAFVAQASKSVLDVVELPATGAPKIVYQLDLGGGPPVAVAAAGRTQVLAVVRADDVVIVDTTSPLRPTRSTPRPLPKDVRLAKIVAADLSPDGKLLAVATADGNRVVLLDLVRGGRAPVAGAIVVLPDVRQSTLVDVAFSPTGDTLWVLSGDTARSRAAGPQPTELRAIRIGASPESLANLDIARVVRIEAAVDPSRMTLGRALPLASGAAIRPSARADDGVLLGRQPAGRRAGGRRTGRCACCRRSRGGRCGGRTSSTRRDRRVPRRLERRGHRRDLRAGAPGPARPVIRRALAAGARDGRRRLRAHPGHRGRRPPGAAPAPVDVLQATARRDPAASRPAPQLRIQP